VTRPRRLAERSQERGTTVPKTAAAPWSVGVAFFSYYSEHRFIYEVLDHAGIAYTVAGREDSPDSLAPCRAWIVVSQEGSGLPAEWAEAVRKHADAGGALVFLGNPVGLEDFFGVKPAGGPNESQPGWLGKVHSTGEGYFRPAGEAQKWIAREGTIAAEKGIHPLHFFGGAAVVANGAAQSMGDLMDAHQSSTNLVPAVRVSDRAVGIFVDLIWTVRRLMHGIPVVSDGVPAPDGSAPLDDNILKAEDGLVQDWTFDRSDPCEEGFPFFCEPLADQWKEFLLGSLFSTATAAGAPLRIIWYYPDGHKALGHISFDTDQLDPDKARRMLEVVDEIGLPGTWLMISPGYTPESGVVQAILDAGEEIGLHFNAGINPDSRGAEWSFENFKKQYDTVAALNPGIHLLCNKDHYTRWQNATDIVEWCAAVGIEVDESRLPSKPGTLGFFSGSSHPWYHHNALGEAIPCLEIAGYSQDPIVTVPPPALHALLREAVAHNGVVCYTFHPAHIKTEGVKDALESLVKDGRERGIEWWRAKEVVNWEKRRRAAQFQADGSVKDTPDDSGRALTVLELSAGGDFCYLEADFKVCQ